MIQKYSIGFIILNYKTYEDTYRCAKSIQNLKYSDKAIILIIDNASGDDSLEKLKKLLFSYNNIIYMENDRNDGYSRANNKAYRYLKENYNLSYIVLLNNDTKIKQKNFISVMTKIGNDNQYDFIGPDVYAPRLKCHQNPLYTEIPTLEEQEKNINQFKHRLKNIDEAITMQKRNYDIIRIKRFLPCFIVGLYKLLREGKRSDYFKYKRERENVVLVGACIIITKKYIDNNYVIFEPTTQFYYEEIMLAERCRAQGLISLYTPKLKVLHYHGVSTHKAYDDVKKYITFTCENTINSFEVYKKYFFGTGE